MIFLSVGSSDLLFGLAFSSSNTGSYFNDSCQSVFSFLDFSDGDLWWVDWDLIWSSVCFVLGELVNMDDPLLSEYLDDFALVSFMSASQDDNLVILSDWEGSETVFFSQIFRKSGRHDGVSDVRRSCEMGSSGFSSWAGDLCVGLHNYLIFMVLKNQSIIII